MAEVAMRSVRIAAIVLAAGESRRLGRPKQDLVLDEETLLDRAVRVAADAGLLPIVVLRDEGQRAELLRCRGIETVINPNAAEGMASSIRTGMERAIKLGSNGAVLMTCDQVLLRAEHLKALSCEPDRLKGSGYAGRIGVPAYFPVSSFAALLNLHGDIGARELLLNAEILVAEELSLDVDTEADLRRAEALFAKPPVP